MPTWQQADRRTLKPMMTILEEGVTLRRPLKGDAAQRFVLGAQAYP